jgi:hypothetical protein
MEITKKTHIEKTWKGFSYNILGITLPFILSLIPILVLKEYQEILAFLDDGQFLIFGAGLFSSSYFLYSENLNSIKKKEDKFLSNLCFWAIIICSSFYSIIYCLKVIGTNFSIDLTLIRLSSIFLYLIASYSIFRSIHLDFLKIYPEIDVRSESAKEIDGILEQLNK